MRGDINTQEDCGPDDLNSKVSVAQLREFFDLPE